MSYDSYVLSLAPAGYWKLAEASGTTATDSSGNGRTGTYNGSPSYGQTGLIAGESDTSVYFGNTSGDYVSVPADSAIDTAGSFTAVVWLEALVLADIEGGALISVVNAGSGAGWDIEIDASGHPQFNTAGGGVRNVTAAAAIAAGSAYMLAAVYDSVAQTIKLYVNGVSAGSTSVSGTWSGSPAATPLWIANQAFNLNNALARIAQAAYWTSALSAGTIASLYAGGPTGPTITIGGSAAKPIAGTLSAQQQIGQRGQGSISVWGPLGTLWPYGTRIVIEDANGNTVYTGYVSEDKAYRGAGAKQGVGVLTHDLTLMDNAYRADKRYILTSSYLNEDAGNIFADLVNTYLAAEGVTMTGSVGLGSIASGVLVPEKAWVLTKVSEAFDWLADQAGYWWQIDSNGVAWFQPYTGIAASGSIDGTTIHSDDNLYVKSGNPLFVDRQYVKGGYDKTPQRTEYFKGDGVKRAFTLAYELSDMVSVLRNGAGQTTGTKGVDSGKNWYFAVGDAVIAEDDAGFVLGSGDTLAVTYKGRFPIIGLATSPTLISTQAALEGGGTGYVESVVEASQVYDQATATQQAAALLEKYGADAKTLEYYTLQPGTLAPGQSVSVTLSDFGLAAKTMLVTALEILDGPDEYNFWYHFTLVGSPVGVVQWENFYKRALKQTPDWTAAGNIQTVVVVAGAMQANAVLSVTAQVVAPAGSDVLQANAVLS